LTSSPTAAVKQNGENSFVLPKLPIRRKIMITEFLTLALVIAASVGLILLVLIHDKKSAGCGDAVTGYAAFIEKSKYLNILRLK
jgi:hypothetical protein